jgi:3-(3-hydroxy-phenyl)propionate hydroxylase
VDVNETIPVVIIGRGPIGMTLALRLACQGVRSTIIDPHEREVVDPGSKAVLIARHVMDVTWPLGVGEQIHAEGLAWTVGRTFVRGKQVRAVRIPYSEGLLPRVVNLTQERVEHLLLARLLGEPLITMIDRARVTTVEQNADGVSVEYVRDEQSHTLRAGWAAGCDGSRSTMRKQLGIPFEGYGHDDNFLICDVRTDVQLPPERHFHFDPPFNRGRTVLIHPQPGSTVHVDAQVDVDLTDADEELRNQVLDSLLRAVLGDAPYSVRWVTTYRFKQLRARHFRQGRCFLAGDAAHLTSPYGARGMNSGIADAENLAWRLAMVVNGVSTDRLLDGYETERIYASNENLAITGRTARFMCPITLRDRIKQQLVLRAATHIPVAGRFVDSGSFYEPPCYPNGTAAIATSPIIGTILPDTRIKDDKSGTSRLGELLRRGVAVLWIPGSDSGDAGIDELLNDAASALQLRVIEVSAATASPAAHPRHHIVDDLDGTLQQLLRPTGTPSGLARAVILRPDAYVAAVLDIPSSQSAAERIRTALRETFQLTPSKG